MCAAAIWGNPIKRTSNGLKIEIGNNSVELQCFSPSIVRVLKYPIGKAPIKHSLSVIREPDNQRFNIREESNMGIQSETGNQL